MLLVWLVRSLLMASRFIDRLRAAHHRTREPHLENGAAICVPHEPITPIHSIAFPTLDICRAPSGAFERANDDRRN